MPHSATIICHGISKSGDVERLRFVAMLALVQGRNLEEICSWTGGGGATFGAPGYRWRVVAQTAGGEVCNICNRCEHIVMSYGAGKLEVTVGDGASGIGCGD